MEPRWGTVHHQHKARVSYEQLPYVEGFTRRWATVST